MSVAVPVMPTYAGRTSVTYVQGSPPNHLLDVHIATLAVDSQSLVVASDSLGFRFHQVRPIPRLLRLQPDQYHHPSDLKIRVTDTRIIL